MTITHFLFLLRSLLKRDIWNPNASQKWCFLFVVLEATLCVILSVWRLGGFIGGTKLRHVCYEEHF